MSALPVVDDRPALAEHVPGSLESGLAALWQSAGRRVNTLRYWRESLALRRRFHLRFLRLGQLKVAVPRGKTPDCDACTEICCTGPDAVVSLRLRDIAALVDAGLERHIAPSSAVRPALAPSTRRERKAVTWARQEADGSVFHQVFPVLARDDTGTCSLLTEDRLCGAYPHWPLSCARYPYALDLRLGVVFYARSCGSYHEVPAVDAPVHVRALLRAVVDAYNERVKDAVLLHVARPELEALGLLRFLDLEALKRR